MTEATIGLIAAATAPTITALAGLVVGIRNSRKSSEIHVLVNSSAMKLRADLADANAQIEELKIVLNQMIESAKDITS